MAGREAADAPVCEFVTRGKARGQGTAQITEAASARLQKALTEYLFTWFLLGPRSGVHDGASIDLGFCSGSELTCARRSDFRFQPKRFDRLSIIAPLSI
jgi:transposase